MTSSQSAQRLIQRLWRFCDVLRDDGLSYPDYVEQLTYSLFLKMAHERGIPATIIGDYGWSKLIKCRGAALRLQYTNTLRKLSKAGGMLGLIYRNAQNKIKDPKKLQKLVIDMIDRECWSDLGIDVKSAAYEGLLDKTAQDIKSGAGQYFTPRPLIEAIIAVLKPRLGETICDPAVGTAGFLLAAHKYLVENNPKLTATQKKILRLETLRGVELVDAVARLGAMNLFLHGIGPSMEDPGPLPIEVEDSLGTEPSSKVDIVVTNPPFGRKSAISLDLQSQFSQSSGPGGRADFIVSSNNKQLNFLQHGISLLKSTGRAAFVVPDNVLFEAGAAARVRRFLLSKCNLHTILLLPTGIFYAQGVRASVIFFDRRAAAGNSPLWIYDLRSSLRVSLRTNPLNRKHLDHFIQTFSNHRNHRDHSVRAGRWIELSRGEILSTVLCRLDVSTDQEHKSEMSTTSDLTREIISKLEIALLEMTEVAKLLG